MRKPHLCLEHGLLHQWKGFIFLLFSRRTPAPQVCRLQHVPCDMVGEAIWGYLAFHPRSYLKGIF